MTRFAYVVGYDISADARRTGFAEALVDLGGRRVQRSVFVVPLDAAGLARLEGVASDLIDTRTDRVHWYRTCGNCPGVLAATAPVSLAPPDGGASWIV